MTGALTVRNGALWFALLGGPAAWTIHLLASYPLVPLACRLQTTAPLNLLTLATAVLAAAAAVTGGVTWRRLWTRSRTAGRGDDVAPVETEEVRGRARFMAAAGAILGLFFVYVIAVEGLPPLLQDPCGQGL